MIPDLKKGETISNEQLTNIFKCGPQGGMRRSKETNTLVLVSDHTKGLYDDRWVGNVLHYTGMGREGDQNLNFAQNKTLNNSDTNGVGVHLFEVFEKSKYTYMGEVKLAGEPYQEKQEDKNGNLRNVWVFKLKLVGEQPTLSKDLIEKNQEQRKRKAQELRDSEIEERAKKAQGTSSRNVSTAVYSRNEYVSEFVKRRANGFCQLCENPAPFEDKNGKPFLETHHIEWLAEGGEDSIDNTVALCPNCHRKMHVLNRKEDKEKLKEKAANTEIT